MDRENEKEKIGERLKNNSHHKYVKDIKLFEGGWLCFKIVCLFLIQMFIFNIDSSMHKITNFSVVLFRAIVCNSSS